MGTATLTLTEFLLARIAADEDEARHARDHSGGSVFANDTHGRLLVQPSRLLAECEAKRRVVERHKPYDRVFWNGETQAMDSAGLACGWCGGDDNERPRPWPCPDLLDLALPYADHPDYRDEWLV